MFIKQFVATIVRQVNAVEGLKQLRDANNEMLVQAKNRHAATNLDIRRHVIRNIENRQTVIAQMGEEIRQLQLLSEQ